MNNDIGDFEAVELCAQLLALPHNRIQDDAIDLLAQTCLQYLTFEIFIIGKEYERVALFFAAFEDEISHCR